MSAMKEPQREVLPAMRAQVMGTDHGKVRINGFGEVVTIVGFGTIGGMVDLP
jgi:hypothetical protein